MILVTGGTGFIGSHLVKRLVAQERRVRCLVRRSSATGNLPRDAIELAYGDLAAGEGLGEALCGVDTVLHLAGITKGRRIQDYYTGNLEGTANLLRAAGEVRRFVHVSSLAAAGPSDGSEPLGEDTEPHPISQYGRSKLAGEEAVRKSPLWKRAAIVRPPVVYGPGDRDVYQLIRGAARGWMLRIGRDDRCLSLIYVDDLVDGLLAAAGRETAGGRIYFMAHPTPVTWDEFGNTAARVAGRRLRTLAVPETAAYAVAQCGEWWSRLSGKPGILSRDKIADACAPAWVCDTRRACRELGFRASTSLEDGMRRTMEWYREVGWLDF